VIVSDSTTLQTRRYAYDKNWKSQAVRSATNQRSDCILYNIANVLQNSRTKIYLQYSNF